MTGDQILDVLEQGFTLERGVLQVSGLEVAYDLAAPAANGWCVRVGDCPSTPTATYAVTTLDFLASGADLFTGFTRATVVEARGPSSPTGAWSDSVRARRSHRHREVGSFR